MSRESDLYYGLIPPSSLDHDRYTCDCPKCRFSSDAIFGKEIEEQKEDKKDGNV